jgi:hypothetical protein
MVYIFHYTDHKGYHEVCRYTPPYGLADFCIEGAVLSLLTVLQEEGTLHRANVQVTILPTRLFK